MYYLTNEELIDSIVSKGYLKSENIIRAFLSIDRKFFIRESFFDMPYLDEPFSIGYGQTISQPTTVAFMLELLDVKEGDTVLDIGSGSGWTTALLSFLAGAGGKVIGVERVPELVEFGKENLKRSNIENALILKAGNELGIKEKKFDKILVSASAQEFPSGLLDQLKNGGNLVIPIRDSIYLYHKNADGEIMSRQHWGFSFVPLIY